MQENILTFIVSHAENQCAVIVLEVANITTMKLKKNMIICKNLEIL